MLQQTQVARVVPRYDAWLARWPTVEALADASAADVIRAWQGLGYNRRALNLHRAARHVAANGWPDDLTELPGVGRYTADAVARFAYELDVLPVDTNVRRVLDRTGERFGPARGPRAHGSRCDDLPGAHPALRLPARSPSAAPPAARPTRRCGNRAVSRARSGSAARRPCASSRKGDARSRSSTAKRSRPCGRTDSSSSRATASSSRIKRTFSRRVTAAQGFAPSVSRVNRRGSRMKRLVLAVLVLASAVAFSVPANGSSTRQSRSWNVTITNLTAGGLAAADAAARRRPFEARRRLEPAARSRTTASPRSPRTPTTRSSSRRYRWSEEFAAFNRSRRADPAGRVAHVRRPVQRPVPTGSRS